ncbi:MAG: hypothetical protein AB8C84_04730 [Oligoflexales bacterium]
MSSLPKANHSVESRRSSSRVSREARHILNPPLRVLARPLGMRVYGFELIVTDISNSGMLLVSATKALIPFTNGVKINATIDLSCRLFNRPIYANLEVMRTSLRDDEEISPELAQRQLFGVIISKIEPDHKIYFEEGLLSLSNSRQTR